MNDKIKIAFVTNICPHYRVKTFEALAKQYNVDYYFFSLGGDWYWQKNHGIRIGDFNYEYLHGFNLGHTRVNPSLPIKLYKGDYDIYIKCINGRLALPATYLIARLRRRPFILWTGIWTRLQTPMHKLLFSFTRYLYHHANAIVVYGSHVRNYLISEGVPSERIFIAAHAINNGAYNDTVSDDEKYALRQKSNISPKQKVILYLGRLEKAKGLQFLLRAYSFLQIDDAVLILAGTGSEQPFLAQLADELKIADRVHFTGYIPPDKTLPYYANAWVFVLPSITVPQGKEPWGLVVNEAFNQGVPVIATTAVGAAAGGLVQDGVNGLVVPEKNSMALAEALQTILISLHQREEFSKNARKIISTWDNSRMVSGFTRAIEYCAK
jgi:glycosyltransferase involved in cell wall biosynthesis